MTRGGCIGTCGSSVLASWALPCRFPEVPDEDLPAVHTEAHPLDYLDFEGEIAAFGEDGRPSFERLQRRMHLTGEAAMHPLLSIAPVVSVIQELPA
jgi:hypothetical protein